MKKLSCFLLLTAWAAFGLSPLSAQTTFGLHGGLNYGTIHYKGLPHVNVKEKFAPGYFVGTSVQKQLPKRWAVGLDAQYAMKASRLGSDDQIASPDVQYQNYYLEIAPRAEYFFAQHFGISLGLYTAYLLQQRGKPFGSDKWIRTDKILDLPHWDAGVAPGISLRFGRAFGFLRYNHGFMAIEKLEFTNDQGEIAGTVKLFNRYFQAGIGYVIFE